MEMKNYLYDSDETKLHEQQQVWQEWLGGLQSSKNNKL